MRRKDGKRKRPARRTMPKYEYGFRNHPATAEYRHSACDGVTPVNAKRVVSLFAGCGGMDLGFLGGFTHLGQLFEALPFDIVAAIDNSKDAVETYRLNLSDDAQVGDLTKIKPDDLPPADVLIGGFPCQDFSSCGPKVGLRGERGQLYTKLADYMQHHMPAVVVGENVPHLARMANGEWLETILSEFESIGYHFDVWDLYAPDYGLSQSRRRLFLVGVRDDLRGYPSKPAPSHSNGIIPIDIALADLESVDDESVTNQSQFYVASRASSGGGQGDHTNERGKVSYCIRANSRGRIQFHYSKERRLTVRECARLQAFPDEFVFPYSTQRNLSLIGNAVPPILAHRVAASVKAFLDGVDSSLGSPAICMKPTRVRQASFDFQGAADGRSKSA